MTAIEAIHKALRAKGEDFATVILDEGEILLTFVHNATDYIITVKEPR